MSYSEYSERSSQSQQKSQSQSDRGRILGMLGTAILLIAGMFLGRYLTKSEMQAAAAHWDERLSSLQAELELMRQQAAQPSQQQMALDQLTDQYQRLSERSAEQAELFAARQEMIDEALATTAAERRACLDELRRYQRSRQSLSAEKVARFAEGVFDARRQMLTSLAAAPPSASSGKETVQMGPALQTYDTSVPEMASVSGLEAEAPESRQTIAGMENSAEQETTAESIVTIGADAAGTSPVELPVTDENPAVVFFEPPRQRRVGYTFITPRRTSRVASAKQSGIVFSDDPKISQGPIIR